MPVAWGHNGYGQCDLSTEHGLSSIRAGGYVSLAIVAGPGEGGSVAPLDVGSIFTRVTHAEDGLMSRVKETVVLASEADKVTPGASEAATSVAMESVRLEDRDVPAPPAEEMPRAAAPRDEVRASATEGDQAASVDAPTSVAPVVPVLVASTSEGAIHPEAEPTPRSERDAPAAKTSEAKSVVALTARQKRASVVSQNVTGTPSDGGRMVSRSFARALMVANSSVALICVGAGAVVIGLVLLCVVYFRRRVPRPSAKGQPVQEDDKEIPFGLLPEELQHLFTKSSDG
jgi:hypothetical protein